MDFLNSIASPVDAPVEWLSSGEDFLNWLSQADLVKPEVLQHMRRSAGPGELDAVAAQARALRNWFRSFVTSHMGARLGPEAIRELEPLNRLLARDEVYGQIVSRNATSDGESISGLAFVADRRWRSADSLLLPLAKVMADLVTTVDFTQIKGCEWHTCTLLFVDTTRGQIRRWCSMAVCGNRAKQATHRERSPRSSKTKQLLERR
ncbi:CGNR zinc finger domain-containing protein [Variovorax sp. WS11]|uniref:CGNR zinc finger domain-containing protein n=1 Tax=Variovorax sp. WS11 TaxID=1105204 RepID=UPI001EF36F96|nr:CGNR zinc finger domain-containing protein [Variovorax sp. WS11]